MSPAATQLRAVTSTRATTTRALRAASIFGLSLADPQHNPDPAAPAPIAAQLAQQLAPGETCLLTGASGAGKSTTLRSLARLLGDNAITARPASDLALINDRVIDLMRSPLDRSIRLLAAAGLGEAGVLLRRARELSEGQRSRLALALAMEAAADAAQRRPFRANPALPITLLVDEFGSTLDRTSARCIARTASRWAASHAVRLVAATAHDDLADALGASLIATFYLNAPARLRRRPNPAPDPDPLHNLIDLRRGTPANYAALASWHYRAGPPATRIHTLTAIERATQTPIGVLTVSMPTLNSPVRDLAWPGRYRTAGKRADAKRLNAELRTISRVIVDPRWRGVGIASRLVRAYLAAPLTPATEAIAAMGSWCPFFEAAGMTAYPLPIPRRHARLLDALDSLNLRPWELADPRRVLTHLRRRPDATAALLARELAIWADASRATRRLARADLRALLDAAARAGLASPAIGYAHTAPGPSQGIAP